MTCHYYFLLALIISLFGLLAAMAKESITDILVLSHLALVLILLVTGSLKLLLTARKEKSRTKIYLTQLILISCCLIAFLGWQSWLSSQKIFWDLSKQKIYSLAPDSAALLQKVTKPLNLFFVDDFNSLTRTKVDSLLSLYAKKNPLITYQIVDPRFAKQVRPYLNAQEVGSLYFEYGAGDQALVGKTKLFTEIEISKAIHRIVAGSKGKIYYVYGHGEPDPESEAQDGALKMMQVLQSQNLELHGLILGASKEVPADAKAVIVAAGMQKYLAEEEQLLKAYLARGGSVLLLSDPERDVDLNFLLADYGIKIGSEIVLDQSRLLQDAPQIGWQVMTNRFGDHPITSPLTEQKAAVFLIASPLLQVTPKIPGKITSLIMSSSKSWGEKDLGSLNQENPQATFDSKQDLSGPLDLALAYQGLEEGRLSPKIVVFSDLEWLLNANLEIYANKELLVRSVNWLVGEQEELQINARYLESASMQPIEKADYQKVFMLALLIPEILLILLLSISYRRKNA